FVRAGRWDRGSQGIRSREWSGWLRRTPRGRRWAGVAGRGWGMTEVRVGKDESLDSALRRFKRQVKRSGILTDAKRHEHYESPSAKRRRKLARRRRRGGV